MISAESCVYSPGDLIIPKGKLNRDLLFFNIGEAVTVDEAGKVLRKYGKDLECVQYYGEFDLFEGNESVYSLKARSYCELFALRHDIFEKIKSVLLNDEEFNHMLDLLEKMKKQQKKINKIFGEVENHEYKDWKKIFLFKSMFRNIWGTGQLLYLMFMIVVEPIRVAYFFYTEYSAGTIFLIILDFIYDILYLFEVIFNAFYFSYTINGLNICERREIKQKYFSNKIYVLDIISLLPIEYITLFIDLRYFSVIRLVKIIRVVNVFKYLESFDTLLSYYEISFNYTIKTVFKFIAILLLYSIYAAAFLFLISSYMYLYLKRQYNTWIQFDNESNSFNLNLNDWNGAVGFIRSMYFIIGGVTTIAYGDMVPLNIYETVYISLIVVVGGVMYPAIIGSLASLMMELNATRQNFKHKTMVMRKYMDMKSFPMTLKDKVIRYYDYIWSRQHGIDELSILKNLSAPLRISALEYVISNSFSRVPFFSGVESDCIKNLYQTVEPTIFLPNDIIIGTGEIGNSLYFIEHGLARLIAECRDLPRMLEKVLSINKTESIIDNDNEEQIDIGTSITYKILYHGSYVGECSLINQPSVTTVLTITFCDCFVLTKENFDQVLEEYTKSKIDIVDSIKQLHNKFIKTKDAINRNISDKGKIFQLIGSAEVKHSELKTNSFAHPDSKKRKAWNILCLLIILYYIFSIPMKIVVFTDISIYYSVIDYVFDIIMISNSFLQMFYFGYMYQGQFYFNREEIFDNYKGKIIFYTDVVAMIPFDVLTLFFNLSGHDTLEVTNLWIPIFRLTKLLYALHYSEYFESLSRLVEDYSFIPESVPRLIELFLSVVLVSHIFACGFLFIGIYGQNLTYRFTTCQEKYDKFDREVNDLNLNKYAECLYKGSWIQNQIEQNFLPYNGGDTSMQYLRSFYWSLSTLICIVSGDVVPINKEETIFAIFTFLVGVVINSAIIGNIVDLASNQQGQDTKLSQEIEKLALYLDAHEIPDSIKQKVLKFLDYILHSTQGYDEGEILEDLPISLRTDALLVNRMKHVENCPIFKFLSSQFYKALSLSIKPRVYSPNEVLYRKNDIINSMYFIDNGVINLYFEREIDEYSTPYFVLRNDLYFGEMYLFFNDNAADTAVSVVYSEILELQKSDLLEVLEMLTVDENQIFNNLADQPNFISQSADSYFIISNISQVKKKRRSSYIEPNINVNEVAVKKIFILLPESKYFALWCAVGFLLLIYYLITVLYIYAYHDPILMINMKLAFKSYGFFYIIDLLGFIYYIFDIYLRLSHVSFLENGQLVTNPMHIRSHYLKYELILDLLGVIPIEFIGYFKTAWYPALRLHYIFHLFRYIEYFTIITNWIANYTKAVSIGIYRIINFLLLFAIYTHCAACIHFCIHRYLIPDAKMTEYINKGLSSYDPIRKTHNIKNPDVSYINIYSISFYFTLDNLSSVGVGNYPPFDKIEIIVILFINLFAASFQALICGAVGEYFETRDNSGTATIKNRINQINSYLDFRKVPENLKHSINYYYYNLWKRDNGAVRPDIIDDLPDQLQMDIMYQLYKHSFENIRDLSFFTLDVQREISLKLKLFFCEKDEFIYRIGDISVDVYMINSGIVVTGSKNGDKIELYSGSSFGSSNDVVRTEYAISKSLCELVIIQREDLAEICKNHPDTMEYPLFSSFANNISTYNNKRVSESVNVTSYDTENDENETSPFEMFKKRREAYKKDMGSRKSEYVSERQANQKGPARRSSLYHLIQGSKSKVKKSQKVINHIMSANNFLNSNLNPSKTFDQVVTRITSQLNVHIYHNESANDLKKKSNLLFGSSKNLNYYNVNSNEFESSNKNFSSILKKGVANAVSGIADDREDRKILEDTRINVDSFVTEPERNENAEKTDFSDENGDSIDFSGYDMYSSDLMSEENQNNLNFIIDNTELSDATIDFRDVEQEGRSIVLENRISKTVEILRGSKNKQSNVSDVNSILRLSNGRKDSHLRYSFVDRTVIEINTMTEIEKSIDNDELLQKEVCSLLLAKDINESANEHSDGSIMKVKKKKRRYRKKKPVKKGINKFEGTISMKKNVTSNTTYVRYSKETSYNEDSISLLDEDFI